MKKPLAILSIFICGNAFSQQQITVEKELVSCAINYQRALEAFEIGKFEQVVSLLSNCSSDALSNQEQIDVLLLLCRTYYYERDITNAEERAREIFRLEPEYQPHLNEQPGVQSIFKAVTPKVQQSITFLFGVNFALPNTFTSGNYEGDPASKTTTSHQTQAGIDANLQWKYYTNPGINPIIGLSYSQLRFNRTSQNHSLVFNTIETDAAETDHILKMELGVSYTLNKSLLGFNPMFELGGAYNYMLSSELTVNSNFSKGEHLDTPALDFSDNRKNSFGIFLTVGGLKKVHRGNLMFKIQYYKGITSQVNTDQLYRHQELIFKSYYFDNDFKLNYITIALGYERFYFKY